MNISSKIIMVLREQKMFYFNSNGQKYISHYYCEKIFKVIAKMFQWFKLEINNSGGLQEVILCIR